MLTHTLFMSCGWPIESEYINVYKSNAGRKGQMEIRFCDNQHYAPNAVNWACNKPRIFFKTMYDPVSLHRK